MLLRVAPLMLLAVMLSYGSSANALSTQGAVPYMQLILNYFCFCVLVFVFVIQLSLFLPCLSHGTQYIFLFHLVLFAGVYSPVISPWLKIIWLLFPCSFAELLKEKKA